jgi:signal peptidase II
MTRVARARPHWGVFLLVAAGVVAIDQISKAWLVGQLEPGDRREVIGDLVRIVHGQNDGAIFGLFRDQALLFGLVSVVVIGLIVWYHAASARSMVLSIALGLLLGGAVGNVIDRFRLGYVTDWIDIGIGDTRFYTFNVADSAVSVAVLLLLLLAFWPSDRSDSAGDAVIAEQPDEPGPDPGATEPGTTDA